MKNLLVVLLIVQSVATSAQSTSGYTFVFLHKNPDAEKLEKAQLDKIMEGHLANIDALAKQGKLIVAGPFEGGGGIFILNTNSAEEANAWLRTDPGIQAKRWKLELLPYRPRIGAVCAAKPPYEMVTYTFVRFTPLVTKFTAQTHPQILYKHDTYLKELAKGGNVVAEGIFGDRDGGILVMRGALQPEVVEADPGVQEGLLDVVQKKLWVARGSFCEP